MISINLEKLKAAAADRPSGYLEDVLNNGTVKGEHVLLEQENYLKLVAKYSPTSTFQRLSMMDKARNAAKAVGRIAKSKAKGQRVTVSDKEQERRVSICSGCEFFTGKTCLKCGCVVQWKTKLATEKCPIGKW